MLGIIAAVIKSDLKIPDAAGATMGLFLLTAIGLAGGASFISAPIVMRTALPQANPSLSLSLALAVAFPFNVLAGIPLAYHVAVFLANVR